jgi:outer membrane receptor protein involved in Fe transport
MDVVPPPYDAVLFRFNDGACDANGRFFVGVTFEPVDGAGTGEPQEAPGYWQLSGGVAYVGDRAGSLIATPVVLPAYVKLNAAIEAPLAKALRFRLEADNLFDKRYAASSYSASWVWWSLPS